jgi:uncharacterized protein YjbJ (UPF0337 family)
MNRDVVTGSWKELRGRVKERWAKLTDDDLGKIEGRVDRLVGSIQKRYGYAREEAERQVEMFLKDAKGRFEARRQPIAHEQQGSAEER